MAEEDRGAPGDDRRSGDDGPPGGDDQPAGKGAGTGGEGGERPGEPPPKKGLLQRPILLSSLIAVVGLALIGGLLYWLQARNFEGTDDAFVDAHIVRVAPQIAGQVQRVLVDDNQAVHAGQPLVEINSADVGTRVAQAEAQKAQAEAQVESARAQIATSAAALRGARADEAAALAGADNAQRTLARYRRLLALNPGAVAPQQVDQAETEARQTAAQALAAARTADQRADQIKASRAQLAAGEDQVRAAEAAVNEAGLTLGYARIVAPLDGHVAQKTVAVGAYVQPGTELLALVPTRLWVTANFKETQLALMRPGQPVEIRIDACPKERIRGHVDSVERGAGQAFGILPPENATGNYVKVVQRVPVKILFDEAPKDCLLGPGMSAEPKVRVR
jgi:membrane fusion protein (multidrug efflux system)